MTSASRRTAAAAVCLLLALIHTWPLALHPARYSRNDNGDAMLNEWILAWVEHQLPRDPMHLFEGNIFYPAHDVLAFSEPLIVPALMGAPFAWAGASPVLVFNLMLLAGFALTAFATFWVVESWTGDALAGLLAGSVFAFNTHTLTRLAHVQAAHIYGLPLALLALERLIRGGPVRDAMLLALWIVALAYTSGYSFVFASVMLPIAFLIRAREWWPNRRIAVPRIALAALIAGALIAPLAIPYARVARDQHMVRSIDDVKEYSATPRGYLATAGRLHYDLWSHALFRDPVDSFFPGLAIILMAGVAIAAATRRRSPDTRLLRARVGMLAAIAIAGFLLSLGPSTPVYRLLFAVFPPLHGLRAAARFGNLFLLGIAMLGGLGLAACTTPRWLAIVIVVIANAESLRAPFPYRAFTGIPGVYKLLAFEPGRVVVAEQPFFPRTAVFENAPYVLDSTAYWRPLMNGYSGYTPDTYQKYADSFWYFPEDRAIKAMKDAGVTHVIVHPAMFLNDAAKVMRQVEARPDLELMAIGPDGMRIYRLK
jgi:hypothetical protein